MLILMAAAATVCDAQIDRVLASHPMVVEYCERCGDKAPGMPHVAEGRPADLASTYVKTSDVRYQNLALLANCVAEPVDVPSLKVLDETPTGVLIVPDTAQVDTVIAESPPLAAPVVTPPPHVMVFHEETTTPWWWAIAAVGGGTVVNGGAVLWLVTRRRRLHEPRALHITK